ncbi:hypothetical protein [Leifsonia poae]|uniref:hypothetical protein n=1 Tax=Leifsonia poae TaxID=110933 RepID=UPI001CBE769B|nr:hypothetical protein [Leifsonia poae]
MTTTLTRLAYTGTLEIVECANCHMHFGVLPRFQKDRRDDHKMFYCPSGHSNYYSGKSEAEKLSDQLAVEKRRRGYSETALQAQRDQTRATERSLAAYKGHLTRARNKIAAGNCPVPDCGQHFSNVREHMKHKHADWHLIDPETGKAAEL